MFIVAFHNGQISHIWSCYIKPYNFETVNTSFLMHLHSSDAWFYLTDNALFWFFMVFMNGYQEMSIKTRLIKMWFYHILFIKKIYPFQHFFCNINPQNGFLKHIISNNTVNLWRYIPHHSAINKHKIKFTKESLFVPLL